ncbi:MAG TPA: DUF192 domain-containing protein [Polyangiales bacterium]|nr:DUF192 domain-containing protein [Polyangiales bacterium]
MSATGQLSSRSFAARALALWGSLALISTAGCRTTATGEAQPATSHSPEKTPASAAPAPALPRVVISSPGQDPVSVTVEVVETDTARQRGLMYRKHLAPDAGMLFIFEREEPHNFWMHNTLIPLDMLFIKADWTVLGIVENATPLTDSLRGVPGASQYVLEVNAGFSRSHGLQAGSSVRYIPAGANAQ